MRFLIWLIIVAVVFGGGYFAASHFVDQKVDGEIKDNLEHANRSLIVDYRKAHYDLLSKVTTISNVDISRPNESRGVRIEKATIHHLNDTFPRSAHFTAEGIKIDYLSRIPQVQSQFEALGIDNTPMTLELDYTYSLSKKRLEIRKLVFGSEELGFIEFSGVFSDFDTRKYDINEKLNPIAILGFSLEEAMLKFEDAGIGSRYTEQQARASGMSVENWIKQLGESLGEALDATNNDFNSDLVDDLTDFLSNPKNVQIELSPSNPVSLAELVYAKNEQLPELLGLDVDN